MAWEDVPAKLAEYRTIEYGGDENADRLLAAFYGWQPQSNPRVYGIEYVPEKLHAEFEDALDYRLNACRELVRSRAWDKEKIRRV